MTFCWHKWRWHPVTITGQGQYFQPGYCCKCGKAKIKWLAG
jgi:hypothetical protein